MPGGGFNVFGGFGVELEGGEDDDLRFGAQVVCLLQGVFYLALFQGGVFGAERDDGALGFPGGCGFADAVAAAVVGGGFGIGVKPAGGQRLYARERDALAALAANSGLQQFAAPIALAQGFAGAGDGGVCGLGRRGGGIGAEAGDGFDHGGGDGFYGEGAGDAGLLCVFERLVVEKCFSRRLVIAQGCGGYRGNAPIAKAAVDALVGVCELVVIENRCCESLLGECEGNAGGVAGNPAAAPLLGDECGSAATAGRVKDEVTGIGGHENAALNGFGSGFYHVSLVFWGHWRCPNIVDPPSGNLLFVSLPR